ncbi:MAG: hypothetical protein ABR506_02505 [Candidatus Krumholzibacteriia bacterium]
MLRPGLHWRWALAVVATAAGAALWAGPASATEADMVRLPVTSPYLCLACHTQESPGGGAPLNVFGEDYLANGRRWDADLAQLDSDGDGCRNGAEVGDVDGNGQADGNVTEQAGNPGVADDCGSGNLVDETTWSTLKAYFDGR